MTLLAEHVAVSQRFSRSANLERDVTAVDPLEGYIATARAVDVVERLANRALSSTAGGAWSITGPYGSGKSSLALLIDGAFGEEGPIRDKSLELLSASTPDLAATIIAAHERHDTTELGFCRAVATARREPISHTVLRALHSAVLRRFGRIPPASKFKAARELKEALADASDDDARRSGPNPAALLTVARCLAETAPLLIVIDEFGKNLEAIGTSADADPYLLQQLAEAGQGGGASIFTLTLQHLSFEDYFTAGDSTEHREWAKVQGRFEDVPFTDSPAQTRALIATVFDVDDSIRSRVDRWAGQAAKVMGSLGFDDLASREVVASCFPLHPLAVAVLPELCSRYGQNERTLFSFLSGTETSAVPAILARRELKRGALPLVGLADVYDYFIGGGAIAGSPGAHTGRWLEVATRLRDAHGLSAAESELVKSVAVLNLVGGTGTVRASSTVLGLVASEPEETLARLETLGLVTYRAFADEYRVWQGSDLDVRRLFERAVAGLAKVPLIEVLARLDAPSPVIAARHSAEYDTLRVFTRRYATSAESVTPPGPFAEADGEVLLVVDGANECPPLTSTDQGKPVVVAVPDTVTPLDEAARNLAAIHHVIEMPEVRADWVVRSELGEQLAAAEAQFNEALSATFDARQCSWHLLTADGPVELQGGRGTAALSAAADAAYGSAPRVGNEMINRTEVTSQGAKARRMLLTGMIERSEEQDLGFEGYGPEVAMYRAVLERTGLHRPGTDGGFVFADPKDPSLLPAWQILKREFTRAKRRRVNLNDVYGMLLSPPVGMKAALVPVVVTAGLLTNHDEIAIYEHGTFKATLEADMSERMVKNPGHFEIKHYANAKGARREVIEALAAQLGVTKRFRKHRVGNVLAIVGHVIGVVQQLDNYALRTRDLSDPALAARDVLTTAVEPDELLFERLPEALGFPPVPTSKAYSHSEEYANALRLVVEELSGRTTQTLEELLAVVLHHGDEPSRRALAGPAAAIENEIVDPEIRSFVLAVATEAFDDDLEWVNNVATVVAKRAVAEWSDGDRARFEFELPAKMAALRRLLALHIERRSGDGEPFEAMRVTFTRPDGAEDYMVLTLDEHTRDAVGGPLEQAVGALTEVFGTEGKAREALLATLAEHVLPTVTPSGDNEVIDIRSTKAANG